MIDTRSPAVQATDAAALAYEISQRMTTLHEIQPADRDGYARVTHAKTVELAQAAARISTALYRDAYHAAMQAAREELKETR